MKKFAYVRVRIADQNTARQLEGMPEVDRVYEEKISGKNTKRLQLQMLWFPKTHTHATRHGRWP